VSLGRNNLEQVPCLIYPHRESYKVTLSETREMIATNPAEVQDQIVDLFEAYELPKSTITELATHLTSSPHLDRFLMRFHHTLPEPERSRAITCALTIACGYFIGGFIPLLPYIFVPNDKVLLGLWWSIGIMIVALFVFGYTKTAFVAGWSGWRCILGATKGGVEMVIVGSVAAGAAMGLVIAFDHGAKISEAATAVAQ
jgi:vacuolar iron transporter family protein